MPRLVLSLGESRIAIDYDPAAARLIAEAFPGGPAGAPGQVRHQLTITCPSPNHLVIRNGSVVLYDGADLVDGGLALLNTATELLAGACGDGLVFHAACIGWGDRAVLVPGGSGMGKTTLTGWLLRRGALFVSDEIVHVDTEGRASSFPRALVFKGANRTSTSPAFVRAHVLGAATAAGPLTIAAILCVERRDRCAFALEPLSRGEAALRLMSALVNAENLEGNALRAVADLSRRVSAFRLRYADVDRIDLEALLTCSSSAFRPVP